MNGRGDRNEEDDLFTSLLASYDEAMLAAETPRDTPQQLGKAQECLRRLEQLWPRSTSRQAADLDRDLQSQDPIGKLDRFQVLRPIGSGGFGVVFLAHDPTLHRDVALKVPRPDVLLTVDLRDRFLREAMAAAGLDHPNIVPVYEAKDLGGSLFYIASAYCPGPTLAQWLQIRTNPVPCRNAAEQIAILADAIAHAHSRGVIHRDLKPSNILLENNESDAPQDKRPAADRSETSAQSFDDTQIDTTQTPVAGFEGNAESLAMYCPRIADFGLAKVISSELDQTSPGLLMGTPSYMAPEQADENASSDVGPAVDVYALGAILYELLTGRPPFVAESRIAILQQLSEAPPVPPRRLRARVPRDLETICLKCLRKDPHNRYATGKELADDLNRYLSGSPIRARRIGRVARSMLWSKRNPASAALISVIALSMVAGYIGLSVLLSNASRAKKEAEALLEDTRASYLVAVEQGDRAHERFEQAHATIDFMLKRVATTDLGNAPGMEKVRIELLKRALGLYQGHLASALPGSDDELALRFDVAFCFESIGSLAVSLGQSDRAETELRKAIEIYHDLKTERPRNSEYFHGYARALNSMANLLRKIGDVEQAEVLARRAIETAEQALHLPGTSPSDQSQLGEYQHDFSTLLKQTNRPSQAESMLENALKLHEDLVNKFPQDPNYRRNLATHWLGVTKVRQSLRRYPDAIAACQKGIVIYEQLVEEHPDVLDYQSYLGLAIANNAYLLRLQGKYEQGESEFHKAIRIQQKTVDRSPLIHKYHSNLAASFNNLADLLRLQKRLEESCEMVEQAISHQEIAHQQDPRIVLYREFLGTQLGLLARNQWDLKEVDGCRESYEWSIELREQLCKDYPDNSEYHYDLGADLNNLALLCKSRGDFATAESMVRRAIEHQTSALNATPNRKKVREFMRNHHDLLGDTLGKLGRYREGVDAYRKAIELEQSLLDDYPSNASYHCMLGCKLHNLARYLNHLEEFGEARELLDRAVLAQLETQQLSPKYPGTHKFLRNHYWMLCLTGSELRDFRLVAESASKMIEVFDRRAEDLFTAASYFARCVELAEASEKIDDSERDLLVNQYGDKSIQLLRECIDKGFNEKKRLEKDTGFDSVRQREDFLELQKSI